MKIWEWVILSIALISVFWTAFSVLAFLTLVTLP